MDTNRAIQDLFSRGSTPPVTQPQHQPAYPAQHHSPPNQIDSLFHNLSTQSDMQNTYDSNSAPTTPVVPLADDTISSSASVPNNSASDRQSALLSLLGAPSATSAAAGRGPPSAPAPAPAQMPQQVPTPPGSSQRSGTSPSHNETQGKILLEQLMAGNPPRSNYSDSQRASGQANAPSPPYASSSVTSQREGEYRNRDPYNNHDPSSDLTQRHQGLPQPPQAPQQQQQTQQPPSPRKSMFDFVSPFDALSSTSAVKKKPVPPQPASISSGNDDSGWSAISDPKRQSVENLLEHLTRSQPPAAPPIMAPAPAQSAYDSYSDFSQADSIQARTAVPPPLQPKPRNASPRLSPPKTQATQRPPPRTGDSQQGSVQGNRRDKESSPGPRGYNKSKAAPTARTSKNVSSPSPQTQNIIFDVSQSQEEIQATRDAVKSTAIALVKQDSVFLPGTTIGATHWVAYAMTRGRVRVISRSSGDRTLLQLPPTFPNTSSVTDMAVYVNRLAGVTSDGGFVVWELPETITDDVPGKLLLCVPPASGSDALHSVKWHPKEADTLAVASENKVYLIDLVNTQGLRAQLVPQSDLHHIGQVFTMPSPVLAFDFDVFHYALATISEDSTLTIWNVNDKLPYTTHKIRGEDRPSSLTFVDGGIVLGRKNGTIFQLLSLTTKQVLSTITFTNGNQEDNEMFGHVSYDSRIQTLWVANCRRDSMIAFKLNLDPFITNSNNNGEDTAKAYIEQVIEFVGPKPTIHFVILTADADPHGDEAHAACVAAKLSPGELALVAFSVHSSGVDQILIRKEWFDTALAQAPAKFPPFVLPQALLQQAENNKGRPPFQVSGSANTNTHNNNNSNSNTAQAQVAPSLRPRTPPSEDVEGDLTRDEGGRLPEVKPKGAKGGKNVNWKEREREDNGGKEKEKPNPKIGDAAIINESNLGQALSREIRKTEESLHTRIGRLIGKEMDKQHHRLEEARAHEQVEDFARQEKILKLISTELTRNTTRVVEMAVKNEVQNSVLPSLETITRTEVKAALNDHVSQGLVDFINQSLPVEIEKLLLRPDISNHFAHILSANLTPLIERNIKEAVNKTFLPVYSQQSSVMHQEVLRELHAEIHSVKAELTSWQSDAFRSQESSIRDLEHSVRALSEQVKFLSLNPPVSSSLHHLQQSQHHSPGPSVSQANMNLRQQNLPPVQGPPNYGHHPNFQPPPQPPVMHPAWFPTGIAAPQASHPASLPPQPQPQPPPPPPQQERSPQIKPEQWDEIYLGVLHTQDASKLRELLSRTNPELIMPLNGPSLVSQAVILTLVHRLSSVVGETPPNDESFKTSLWWLQRSVALLRPEDKLITDFIPRVVPNVQLLLNTTKQRLGIIPNGAPTLETARTISDIQETLRRKVMPV